LVYNAAAFSFLSSASGWQRVFITIALIASAWVVYLLWRYPRQTLFCFALSLILGGAVGNVIDRLFLGAVVDFLIFTSRVTTGRLSISLIPQLPAAQRCWCGRACGRIEPLKPSRKGAKTPRRTREIRKPALHTNEESSDLCNACTLGIFAPSRLCGKGL
jgi:hypothetical protein